LRWHTKKYSTSNTLVPDLPGVYVIGHTLTTHDLPIKHVYVYVGISDNLKRRFKEHEPASERNQELADYLHKPAVNKRIWYIVERSKGSREELEKVLIRELKPEFNKIKYKK